MTFRPRFGIPLCTLVAALVPALAHAQQPWLPAACDIKPGNQLVNSGMQSLRSAWGTKFSDQRTKDLKDAEKSLTQAVTTGGQEKNAAAWYYLARYYMLTTDYAGIDSAFSKAQALAPTCKDDIALYRRQAWVPVFNAGVQAWQAGSTDSAIASFRRANQIYNTEPMGFIYIANLFIGADQPDSAAKYFRLAVPAASDPKYARDRRDALFNVARVYHSAKRYDEAAAAYHDYLAAYPNDVGGMASLATLYMRAGKNDSAMALFKSVVDHADSASADELFSAASGILGGIPQSPDTAEMDGNCSKAAKRKTPALTPRQISARCRPAAVDTMSKFHALADPQYKLAVQMYEAGLAKNPYQRDALYNLAGISYMIGDTGKVLPLAQRLYAVDPMNRLTLAKIAGGWQLLGKKDSVLHYLQVADSLPVEINVSNFSTNEKGAELDALATNLKTTASAPLKITFEFLDGKGSVLATQPEDLPALDPSANQQFIVTASQPGIVAWRYKRS